MNINKNLKILDCTLRDGGYYNNWFFNNELVQIYLDACNKCKIDIIELEFRFPHLKKGLGPYAYTSENTINRLKIPRNIKLSVMINASDFFGEYQQIEELISKCFTKKKLSKISIVRIAINFKQYKQGLNICRILKNFGYEVGFNLMQSHNKTKLEITKTVKEIISWGVVDYLYYADSIGVMDSIYIKYITKIFKKYSKNINIGIHAHNNKSQALTNSIEAKIHGINLIDCTILGMGRGAGNTPTEALLLELESEKLKYKSNYILDVLKRFSSLQKKYLWGPNYYYHYAAIHNIHPSYIQNLLDDKRYNIDQVKLALKTLSLKDSNFFSEDSLKTAIYKKDIFKDNFNALNFFKNRDVCILGSGPSGKKYGDFIKKYIIDKNPVVLSLNINQFINQKFIDYFISCYEYRVFFDQPTFEKINKPIIMPYTLFKDYLGNKFKNKKIIDYGLKLKMNSFNVYETFCELSSPLAIAYALAICSIGNAKSIKLAFFDGYKDDALKNSEVESYIKKFKIKNHKVKIKFLTPSVLKY